MQTFKKSIWRNSYGNVLSKGGKMKKDLIEFLEKKKRFVDQVVKIITNNGKVKYNDLKSDAEFWNKTIIAVDRLAGKCNCGKEDICLKQLANNKLPLGIRCVNKRREQSSRKIKQPTPDEIVDNIIKNKNINYVSLFN